MEDVFPLQRELNLLDPRGVRFRYDGFGDLMLEVEGDGAHAQVQVRRGFPLSDEGHFLSVRDRDGRELGMLRDVGELDGESARILAAELERIYFVPRITRVVRIEERFHIPRWEVETDRGPRVFEIRSGRSDVRVLPAGRILIRDADGNPYEIPDCLRLDEASRALVESQI
jgi:hypothetical protein